MLDSRSFQEMCPHVAALLTNLCVRDDDLDAIGYLQEPPSSSPVPPAVWGRILLNRGYARDEQASRVLSDRLDVRHMSEVLALRCMEPEQVLELADEVLAQGDGARLPGMLWAAATDERVVVQRIAARLGFSANLIACRDFVETRVLDDTNI